MGVVSKEPEEEGQQGPDFLITGFGDLEENRRNEVEIDLADWGEAARSALDERMHLLQAPHAWNGSWLVVGEDDVAWIERIIEQVEDEQAEVLDPDVEQVAYDLSGWDDDARQQLLDGLEAEVITFGIEGDELLVHEIDERRVDELVDAIVDPGGEPSSEREARPEVMGNLYVAADRLVHDPEDPEGRLELIAGTEAAASSGPPYGMDDEWWVATIAAAEALIDRLGAEPLVFDEAVEQATALRSRLRPYV
jgi:hypothetical protein